MQLEHKQELFHKYGTVNPEQEYEQLYNPMTDEYEIVSVKELIDSVNNKIRELQKQKEMIECRKYNLLVRDLEWTFGIKVRRR